MASVQSRTKLSSVFSHFVILQHSVIFLGSYVTEQHKVLYYCKVKRGTQTKIWKITTYKQNPLEPLVFRVTKTVNKFCWMQLKDEAMNSDLFWPGHSCRPTSCLPLPSSSSLSSSLLAITFIVKHSHETPICSLDIRCCILLLSILTFLSEPEASTVLNNQGVET